jgi:hypothetical protein
VILLTTEEKVDIVKAILRIAALMLVVVLFFMMINARADICRVRGGASRHLETRIQLTVEILSPSVQEVWLRVPTVQPYYAQGFSQTGCQTVCAYEPSGYWTEYWGSYWLWAKCDVPPETETLEMNVVYSGDVEVAVSHIQGGLWWCTGCNWTDPSENCESDDPGIQELGQWALAQDPTGWGAENWDIMEQITDRVVNEVEFSPLCDWPSASLTWASKCGTCIGRANVIIAALRSIDVPAGFVMAAVVEGNDNVSGDCDKELWPTGGHALFQTWPSWEGTEWVVSDQQGTFEWVESNHLILCAQPDYDYCSIAWAVSGGDIDMGPSQWTDIEGSGSAGSFWDVSSSDAAQLIYHGVDIAVTASVPITEEAIPRNPDHQPEIYDVRGRRVRDSQRLTSGVYFERVNGKTTKKMIVR